MMSNENNATTYSKYHHPNLQLKHALPVLEIFSQGEQARYTMSNENDATTYSKYYHPNLQLKYALRGLEIYGQGERA
jgi:hypothetical protein